MPIYSGKQLDGMRAACALARDILLEAASEIKPGVTTAKVDAFAAELMRKSGCRSAFLGYQQRAGAAFPGNVCISVNECARMCAHEKCVKCSKHMIRITLSGVQMRIHFVAICG